MMVKYGLAMLTLIGAVFAATASGSTASTATVRAAAGSCTGGAVAAVVNETFMCLTIGAPCAVANQDDYAKFQLTCNAGKIAKLTSATVGAAPLADAFLNTGKNDFTTRAKTFKLGGSPPILHLTFKEALKGTHTVRVDLHNAK